MTVFVSAAPFEVQPLQTALSSQAASWITCGIGVIAAAAAGVRARSLCRGQEVLFIGTCGTFAAFTGITLCRARTLHWSPTCARAGLSYAVAETPSLPLNASPCYMKLPAAEVFCAPNVSLVATLPASSPATTLCVENIEAYAFLTTLGGVAHTVDVLLAITNKVGKTAQQQWQQHHAQAAALTATYILQQRFRSTGGSANGSQ